MRRLMAGALALTLLVSACQANVAGTGPKLSVTTAGGNAKLAPPEGPAKLLAGTLKMDASYVISAGGGNVISAGGANVVSAGGGNLIRVGGQVISAGGGNLIGQAGSNLIGQAGSNFRLLAIDVAIGELLPASKMVVVPVSLRTGKPLGAAVLTDASGHYQLKVPLSETGNVRLVAAVPGTREDDPRLADPKLQSELLVATAAAEGADLLIDDDRALASRYLRRTFVGRLTEVLDVESYQDGKSPNPLLNDLWTRLVNESIKLKIYTWSDAEKGELAQRLADSVTSYVDLSAARSDPAAGGDWPGASAPAESCFEAYVDVLKQVREGAIAKLRQDPAYFDTQPFLQQFNEPRAAEARVTIRKATDLGDFVTSEYLSQYGRDESLKEVFVAVGVEPKQVNRLVAVGSGFMMAIGLTMLADKKAQDTLFTLLRDAAEQHGKAP